MKITYNIKNIETTLENARLALIDTAEAVKTDLIQSQTMPFGETKRNGEGKVIHQGGTLQNDSTFVDDRRAIKGVVKIVSDTPYARKMYFHPEYNFNKKQNPNAGGRWFDTYIDGDKKDLPIKYFKQMLKRRNGE